MLVFVVPVTVAVSVIDCETITGGGLCGETMTFITLVLLLPPPQPASTERTMAVRLDATNARDLQNFVTTRTPKIPPSRLRHSRLLAPGADSPPLLAGCR